MSILVLTSDTLIGTAATGNIEYNGQFFGTDSNASRAQMQRIVQGTAVASTSGTSINFTGIPAYVKRITVMLSGVSTNGTSSLLVQVGTSGGVVVSGYVGASGNRGVNDTFFSSGFVLVVGSVPAALTNSGNMTVCTAGSNTWVETSIISNNASNATCFGSGFVALGGTLDRIRLTTVNGTDTFDAGSVNLLLEG